jgi:hypothetical protein
MKAGLTDLEVGTRIRLQNIIGEDSFLNGKNGSITHPFCFGETKKGWVGVRLDDETIYNGKCNAKVNECEIID